MGFHARQDRTAYFHGKSLGWEDALFVPWEEFDKHSRYMRRCIGYGRRHAPLLTDLIERGKHGVAADGEALIFFLAALYPGHNNGGGEPRILQDAAADQCGNFARRRSLRESAAWNASRFRKDAQLVPAAQAVKFIAADFDVELPHRDEVRQRRDFILRREDHVCCADWIRETKFFEFGEAFRQFVLPVPVNPRMRDGLVKGDFRRPLGNRVVAFAAFIQADVDAVHLVQKLRGALDQQVGEPRGRAGVDQGNAMFFFEFLAVADLFRLEGVFRQVGAEIEVVGAKAQSGTQDDFIEDGRRRVDDELAT